MILSTLVAVSILAPVKPLVVVTRRLPEEIETRMCELFDVRLNETDKPLSQDELAEAMRVADVLVPTITDRIDAHLIAQAGENMKLIANFGNGVDNIDVASALGRSITVTNTPGVLTETTADLAFSLLAAAARRIAEGDRAWLEVRRDGPRVVDAGAVMHWAARHGFLRDAR